ncbi:phage tail protein [Paraclostridium tenue]|uniref:Tail spike domain-containing protein n=1 Tax=Paraclostridium tenue TaxID=1737 RepID=A0ABN1LYF0_9FIRM
MKDYLLLLDENERLKRIVNDYEFYDDEIKSTTFGERVFTFKMNDSVVDIENGNKIGVFADGKFDLFIVDQVEAETYYSTSIKVTCLHDFYSIQTQKAITQYYRESVSLRDAMTEMLNGTSYELGECVERALIPIGPYLYKNPLWCIQDIISNFGVEIDYSIELNETRTGISRKLVHVVNALGSDTGIRCSTDLNVSKIKRVQKDKFYTVMYGCGSEYQKDLVKYKYDFKDVSWSVLNGNPTDKPAGQEFVEDKKAIAKYGRIIGIFEDGRIKDPELLLKKTWEALQKNNRPIVSYELDIEELKSEDGYEHLNFKLGDIIILQNTIDNSRAKFRIVEDCVSVRNKNKRKVTVGEQLKGIFSGGNSGNSDGTEGPGGSVIDPGGEQINPPSLEEITPDTLPAVPIVSAKGLWAKVTLSWTYESKMYYNYEVYASKIKDFEPTVFHMIYSGKASAFLHEVGTKETWYYRVRAVNTFGHATEFSNQVEATTTKVVDGTEYFESAAIKDALIEELRLDRGWIGQLDATYLNVKGKFTILDGNNERTMYVDSFGRIELKPSVFTLTSECVTNVSTKEEVDEKVNDAKKELNSNIDDVQESVNNLKGYTDGAFKDNLLTEDEKSKISGFLKPLETEFIDVTKEYNTLYSNSDLVGTPKTNLKNSYDSYKLKYDGLISTINSLLKLTNINNDNKLALDNAYREHDTMLANYRQRVNEAVDSIAFKKANASLDSAKTYTNAQIKVVNDAINLKVSKQEYDENKNVINDKFTEFDQTFDDFNFKFQNLGAPNEVDDSNFGRGTQRWKLVRADLDVPAVIEYSLGYNGGDIMCTNSAYIGDCSFDKSATWEQRIYPKNNKMTQFTLSGCYHYTNVRHGGGVSVPMANLYMEIHNKDGTVEYYNHANFLESGVTNVGWKTVHQTYTRSNKAIDYIKLIIYKRNTVGELRITQIDLHENGLHRKWIPGANEINNHITTVDANGVKVDSAHTSQFARIDEEFFCVYNGGEAPINRQAFFGLEDDVPTLLLGAHGINPGVQTFGGTHLGFKHYAPDKAPYNWGGSWGMFEYKLDSGKTHISRMGFNQIGNIELMPHKETHIYKNVHVHGHSNYEISTSLGVFPTYMEDWGGVTAYLHGIKAYGHTIGSDNGSDIHCIRSTGGRSSIHAHFVEMQSAEVVYSLNPNLPKVYKSDAIVKFDLGTAITTLAQNHEQLKVNEKKQDDLIISNLLASIEMYEMLLDINPNISQDEKRKSRMSSIYVTLINENKISIDDIPLNIVDIVKRKLNLN